MPVDADAWPSPAAARVLDTARRTLSDVLDTLGPEVAAHAGRAEMTVKADGTPVTSADLLVDEHLHATLGTVFPDHGIVSEERDTVVPATDWTWLIDPIDGTSNFTTDLPYWCMSVALAFEGTPLLGVIDAPTLGRRYEAVAGRGARRNGKPVRVRAPIDWTDPANRHVPIMLTMATARHAREAGVRCNVRNMGSAALDMAVVADGTAIASIERIPHAWDIAAGSVIVSEAGGTMIHPQDADVFPLRPGDDHRTMTALTVTAVDHDVAQDLAEALVVRRRRS